jgi:hypothetical protein
MLRTEATRRNRRTADTRLPTLPQLAHLLEINMSRSRAKGTAWESAVVAYLRAFGATLAERRALNGSKDRGDIAGLPGVVIEAKSATRLELAGWLDEAETEGVNDSADIAAVWIKRRGRISAGAGYAVMSGETFARLLRAAGYIPQTPPPGAVAALGSPAPGGGLHTSETLAAAMLES